MKPYYDYAGVTIYHGDCREILPGLAPVDLVLTDPPYGLSFMGKAWDHGVPGKEFWIEALRVCKPGAFLLSFGGTRTFHRLTCAIEDAGFEIRDCMMWLYGSGFPKSHDVSKAIDKAAGVERKVIGKKEISGGIHRGNMNDDGWEGDQQSVTAPATDAAKQWSGWGTALKPAWEPIIVARKPLEGTVAENVQKWGCGGMNIDASRIEGVQGRPGNKADDCVARFSNSMSGPKKTLGASFKERLDAGEISGRWPANVILDEEAGAMLDGQSGTLKSPAPYVQKTEVNGDVYKLGSLNDKAGKLSTHHGDSGGASRFFYCAKASKTERGEGNNHPTVKPISLLNYLAKLACPPGGLILDPFMGSGSTGLAAINNGMRFIGIEKETAYCDIAAKRMPQGLFAVECGR